MFGIVSEKQRISELESKLQSANKRIAELAGECDDYKQSIASFHLATSKYDTQIESLKAEHTQEVAELKQQLAATENSVNKRVNQTLQSIGVNNFLAEIPVITKSARAVYEQFVKMANSSEKTEFFKQHEAEIRAGMMNS